MDRKVEPGDLYWNNRPNDIPSPNRDQRHLFNTPSYEPFDRIRGGEIYRVQKTEDHNEMVR